MGILRDGLSYFVFENKKIYYEEKGEGTPLLILHGNTGSSKKIQLLQKTIADKTKLLELFLNKALLISFL